MGLELNPVVVSWADWPLGVESGKYDAALYNITVTEERKKRFDFSTYRNDQLGIYVKADSPIIAIREPKDIAGLRSGLSTSEMESWGRHWQNNGKRCSLRLACARTNPDRAAVLFNDLLADP